MKLNNLHELFVVHIKDLYSAEKQLIEALPKMAKAATNEKLKKGFEEHLAQTEEHVKRLEEIAKNLDFPPSNHVCKAMKGLIEEGSEFLDVEGEDTVRDAALIGAAQKVEHYEISGYGTAVAMAKLMGHDKEAKLLEQTLDEESKTDERLTSITKEEIAPKVETGMEE